MMMMGFMFCLVIVPTVLHPIISLTHTTHNHTTTAHFQLKQQSTENVNRKSTMPLPRTKSGWIELLREAGEEVPTSWTILQMRTHWEEIKAEKEVDMEETMFAKLKALKVASRKQPDLIEFMQTENVAVNKNSTIAQMFAQTEKVITQRFEPTGSEHLGFGKHGHRTFQEVMDDYLSYAQWCQQTVQETDDCSWRMKRFVSWIHMQKHRGKSVPTPKKNVKGAASSVGSFSVVSNPDAMPGTMGDQDLEIEQLKKQIQQLQEENVELALKDGRSKLRKEM